MKLSEKSHRKIEEFFRETLADEGFFLPEITFYGGELTNIFTNLLKIEGLAVGNRVFIFPGNFWLSENGLLMLDEKLVVHEITHVLQYRREGFWRFLWLYLRSYHKNLTSKPDRGAYSKAEAYSEIPFEIEARQNVSKFVDWSQNRKFNQTGNDY